MKQINWFNLSIGVLGVSFMVLTFISMATKDRVRKIEQEYREACRGVDGVPIYDGKMYHCWKGSGYIN